ncbi:GAF domain-containing protein [Mycolicibacterium sp. BiH015]|uniref:GAF domain-containing protein n=1 Tax=Mycolicibacterium sp. BiH015 TaxID=3018808 RepID=UPI0022E3BCF8|nr:GAF domain-containing protein [Mycolicibacterium sp. BiH015]MDA2894473.1 GAF domain-containing protein [Mycolicibacterium sp. BiH015]
MSISLPGFDNWLTERLEECADDSGERVDMYVARAVAAQMISDYERTNGESAGKLKAHLSQSGLSGETVADGITSVLTNARRLQALHATGLVDSAPDPAFARITTTAADALGAPAAALVLIGADRQSVKSAFGYELTSLPPHLSALDESFDKYVVANGSLVRVDDARHHPLFKTYSVVGQGHVTAYLGVPLTDRAGNTVGALHVSDGSPREWSRGHIQILDDLAAAVTSRIFSR